MPIIFLLYLGVSDDTKRFSIQKTTAATVSDRYKNDESTDALEVKSPICSPLNSEDNELTDSITTTYL